MGKRFVVEEVRATSWTLRLRDSVTGESFDMPMQPGSRFSPPNARDANDETRERKAEDKPRRASTKKEPAAPVSSPPAEKTERRTPRPRKTQSGANGRAAAAGESNPLETHEGRMTPLDEKTLTTADRKVIEEHQALWAHVLGAKGSKKGGLGWEETTDAGRSGLRARFKSGAFKLLHAGGDVYALFYEWDNGRFERIACGKAEDLMALATERALAGLPKPPRTHLDLEMARFFCSSDPKQRELGAKRLEPYFREHEIKADEPSSGDGGYPPPRPRKSRTTAKSPAKEPSPSAASPAPAAADTPATGDQDTPATGGQVDPKRDSELMASFTQALAELEGTE